jgi:hypothetical protein
MRLSNLVYKPRGRAFIWIVYLQVLQTLAVPPLPVRSR